MTNRSVVSRAGRRLAQKLAASLGLGGRSTTLPVAYERPQPDHAQPPRADSAFAPIEERVRRAHGNEASGFRLLDRSEDALRWRLALADSARHTLDLQYYGWSGDDVGVLLLKHVLDAADRGVQVRIILDDLDTLLNDGKLPGERDKGIAMVHAHPNIRVQLFNAWKSRSLVARGAEFAASLERLNHRMHNKQMIADNTVAIIGGRNIANQYMGLNEEFNFEDLDVLGVGPVARSASAAFDRFWNSEWVLSVTQLQTAVSEDNAKSLVSAMVTILEESEALVRMPLQAEDWTAELDALPGALSVGTSRVVTDSPDPDVSHKMPAAILDLVMSVEREVMFSNAYVIPGEKMIDAVREITGRGVKVRVLTNSLASQDVPAVNSKYRKWRKPLVEAGVELHELRPDAAIRKSVVDTSPVESKSLSLHTKAIVVDRVRVFIGSMNLDPRSADLNSEMGVVIESPDLAQKLADIMDRGMLPDNSWRVELDAKGKLRWVSGSGTLTRQPALGFMQRVIDVLYTLFPEEYY
jgi:putative cardiolipin synthase